MQRPELLYTQTSGCGFFDLFVNILSTGFLSLGEQSIAVRYFVYFPRFLNLLPHSYPVIRFRSILLFFNHRKPGHESLNTAGRVLCLRLPALPWCLLNLNIPGRSVKLTHCVNILYQKIKYPRAHSKDLIPNLRCQKHFSTDITYCLVRNLIRRQLGDDIKVRLKGEGHLFIYLYLFVR